jgi:C_GCAxxG_C_C family probable redox protein
LEEFMKDIVKKLIDNEMSYSEEERPLHHINCSEVLMMAADDRYDLNLDERFIKAMFPFGGGLQSENTCGSLISALSILGIVCGKEKPSTNEDLKVLTLKFIEEFENTFGSTNCLKIKEVHRTEEEGCAKVKIATAALIEKFIAESL